MLRPSGDFPPGHRPRAPGVWLIGRSAQSVAVSPPPRLGRSHRPWLSPANVLRKASRRPALPRAPFAQSIGRLFADADRSMALIPVRSREHNIDYVSSKNGPLPPATGAPVGPGASSIALGISSPSRFCARPSPRLQPPPRLFKASHRPALPRAPFAQSIGRLFADADRSMVFNPRS